MAEEGNWTVRPTLETDRRVHFSGLEKDAREFVERNFPRVHIADPNSEPVPDVYVQAPDKAKHTFVNGEWVSDQDENEPEKEEEDANA